MEYFAFFVGLVALALASDSSHKAQKLQKRVASLEELCMRLKAKADAG